MAKTDKELAVEVATAYISTWFSRENISKPLSEDVIQSLITAAYNAIHALPEN